MNIEDQMSSRLIDAFAPESIRIINESERHRGHSGWRESGDTHFRLYIVAEGFRGKSRLERHRMINRVLGEELARIHALAIHAAAPGEGLG